MRRKMRRQAPSVLVFTMKIAIFGGSFDPVHAEHVNIVKAAQAALSPDEVIVMPAFIPPHKQDRALASPEDRLNMAKLAFAGVKNCEVSAYEINAGGTSYTYLTLGYLAGKFPGAQLYFLVGADMLKDFYTWKQPETILSLADLVVCNREGDKVSYPAEQFRFFSKFKKRFIGIEYTGRDISSTKARVLAAFGEDLKPYLPFDVIDYIEANELYRIEGVKGALRYLKPSRRKHTLGVALTAARYAERYKIPEKSAVLAAAMHDVAKNMQADAPELSGFATEEKVPAPVLHQYTGAYVAEHTFGIRDEDVLNAVRYHTSGRPNMSDLEKLIFLSDMLEPSRDFKGVEKLRRLLAEDLNECMYQSLKHELRHLKKSGGEIYPLTFRAYEYYKGLRK